MKTIFAALITVLSLTSVANAGEAAIKVFKNYNAETHKHEGVAVSTLAKPLTLELVFSSVGEEAKTNGACYLGSPQDALKVLGKMLNVMNAKTGDDVRFESQSVVKRSLPSGATVDAIKIEVSQNYEGQRVVWELFEDGIRPCIR